MTHTYHETEDVSPQSADRVNDVATFHLAKERSDNYERKADQHQAEKHNKPVNGE
jgi:hypothetical protein